MMIKKRLPSFGLIAALGMLCVIVSCKNSNAPEISITNYTVSFQIGGGTAIADKIVQEGTALNLELAEYQIEQTGYFFDGWYLPGDTEQRPLSSITVTGDITLVAKWLFPVSVSLEMEGGALEGIPNFSSLRPGSIFEASWYVPSKKGYVFLHWYLKDEPSHIVEENIQVDCDIILVAEWEEGWLVTLELDGGEYYRDYITLAKDDAMLTLTLIRPFKDDYILEGWYYDEAFTLPVPDKITLSSDITLYVKWSSLINFESLFGVWKGSKGTYLLCLEQNGNSLIGFYFSDDEIRSFVWTDLILDGKAYDFNPGTLTVGEGESANTYSPATTRIKPAGNIPLSQLWIKRRADDPVSMYLFEDGSGFFHADGRFTSIAYALRLDNIHLLRENKDENGNLVEAEVLLVIPIVEGKPSGFTEMGGDWGTEVGGEGIVPY
jgi:uncharacterized repeat protein (TIGR02543 family)